MIDWKEVFEQFSKFADEHKIAIGIRTRTDYPEEIVVELETSDGMYTAEYLTNDITERESFNFQELLDTMFKDLQNGGGRDIDTDLPFDIC